MKEVLGGNIKKIRSSKQAIGFIMPLLAVIIVYFINGDIDLYKSMINILCASLGTALSIICVIREDLRDDSLYKYIGYGFLFIGILGFSKLLHVNLDGEIYEIQEKVIKFSIVLMEYLIIIMPFIFKKRNCSKRKVIFYYFIVTTILTISLFQLLKGYRLGIVHIDPYIFEDIVHIGLFLLTVIFIYLNRNNIPKREKKFLHLYSVFILIYHLLYKLNIEYLVKCEFIFGIFKYMSYYMLYRLVAEVLLYDVYDNMKQELVDAQKMQKELNNTLNHRNKMLIEVKSLIEKSESRYSNLIETIEDGIIIFYFDRLSYINEAALNIIGKYNYEEIVGTSFSNFVEGIYTEYSFTMKEDYEESLDEIVNTKNKLNKIYVSNTESREFEIYFLKIDNLNRLVYIKDITETNKNHQLRREYEEYLKEEKLKNEFYSNISHELRTPINLIYSALQINEIYLNNGNLSKIEKNNETIKQNSLRLIRTINNFIDTNKISEGYFPRNIKIYNIVSVVENISLACNKYIEKIENTLIFDANEEEIFVECDKEMIERIILNLLSNSVKYGKKGGTVFVDVEANDDDVMIYVKNNGYIIDEALQPYIFDKFTKINKSLNREKEGSGLGLFLAKALTELQGGTIEFDSNVNIGTEFKLKFKRCYDEENAEQEEAFDMNAMEEKVDTEFSDIYI